MITKGIIGLFATVGIIITILSIVVYLEHKSIERKNIKEIKREHLINDIADQVEARIKKKLEED